MQVNLRLAIPADLPDLLAIYNEGIEDRIATLETDTKDAAYMQTWFDAHQGRYFVLVAEQEGQILGWASVNPYNQRCAYAGVGDVSVYIRRPSRGQGVGRALLTTLEAEARQREFHKLILSTFPFNELGQRLYHKLGYREVGVFQNQGLLDGVFVDVMAMEKLL